MNIGRRSHAMMPRSATYRAAEISANCFHEWGYGVYIFLFLFLLLLFCLFVCLWVFVGLVVKVGRLSVIYIIIYLFFYLR